MKRLNVILLFLVVLTAVLFVRRERRRDIEVQPPVRFARSNSFPARVSRPAIHYATPWQAWYAKDYPSFIAMMRASGCPEQTIQDLVLMQVAREFQAERFALEEARHNHPQWWQCTDSHASAVDEGHEYRQLRLEMAARVYNLLGVEFGVLANRFQPGVFQSDAWISPERRLRLDALLEQFRIESVEIRLGPQGWWGPLDQDQKKQLADLAKSQRAELAAFLTPAELEQYDVRQSEVAYYVREQLPPANSEVEFRTMVKITMETGVPTRASGDERDAENAALKQAEAAQKAELLRKIDAALGPTAVAAQASTAQAQAQAEAERQAQVKAEEDVLREQQVQVAFLETAKEIGVDPALAQKLFDQFIALKEAIDADPSLEKPDDATAEQMAVDVMGEKGHEFVRKMESKSH